MRLGLFLGSLGLTAVAAGCVSVSMQNVGEAPTTPMHVIAWNEAPEGPYEARVGDRLVTQYMTPDLLAALDENLVSLGGHAPEPIAQGTVLFGVVDARGIVRYCTEPDAALTMACFEDVDGDGDFDRGLTAVAADGPFRLAVRRWTGRFDVLDGSAYRQAPASRGPLVQIGVAYLGRTLGGSYGFGLAVGGPEGWDEVTAPEARSWHKSDNGGVFDVAGAEFEILERSRGNAITYRLGSAMEGGAIGLRISNASRTMGALSLVEMNG